MSLVSCPLGLALWRSGVVRCHSIVGSQWIWRERKQEALKWKPVLDIEWGSPGQTVAHDANRRNTDYLTMWYCRHEIQFRQAMFFSAASVAGAFSGLLAFGISKMDGVGNLEGWRW